MKKLLLLSFFTFTFFGCASTSKQPQDTVQETIRYSSSPCFGTCPIYSVEITPEGTVHFNGKQYTKVVGTQDLTVDPLVYKKLQQEPIVLKQVQMLKQQAVSKPLLINQVHI